MTAKKLVALRIPLELLARIDVYRSGFDKGIDSSRSAAIIGLLDKAMPSKSEPGHKLPTDGLGKPSGGTRRGRSDAVPTRRGNIKAAKARTTSRAKSPKPNVAPAVSKRQPKRGAGSKPASAPPASATGIKMIEGFGSRGGGKTEKLRQALAKQIARGEVVTAAQIIQRGQASKASPPCPRCGKALVSWSPTIKRCVECKENFPIEQVTA